MEGVHPSGRAILTGLGICALCLAVGDRASAQTIAGVDGHGYVPPPSDPAVTSPLTVWSPYNERARAWSVGGVLEHVNSPLVQYQLLQPGDPTEVKLLHNVIGVNLGARYAVGSRLGLGITAPVWFTSEGEEGVGGPALGDVHLWAPIGLVMTDPDTARGFGLSAVPFLDLPTGNANRFLGDTAVNVGMMGVSGYNIGVLATNANLGVGIGKPAEFANQLVGGATLYSGGSVGVVPTKGFGVHLEGKLGVGLSIDNKVTVAPPGANDGSGAAAPFEVMLTGRGTFGKGLWANAGVGRGVTAGVGAARLREYLGFGYSSDPGAVEVVPVGKQPFTFRLVDPDGSPVARATISVDGVSAGTSGAEGTIELEGIKWRRGVVASGPNHVDVEIAEPEGEVTQADVVLQWKTTLVQLRVQDQAGAPVVAAVVAKNLDDLEVNDVEGDADGVSLMPGNWRIEVVADGFGPQAREVFVDPNGHPPAEPEVILLEDAGGEAKFLLRLTDPEGGAVVGARILIDGQPVGTSADGGLVEVDLLPVGSHRLQVLHENFTEMEQDEVALTKGVNEMSLALQRVPGSVKVLARGPLGGVVADAVVRFDGPRRLAPAPLGDRGERIQTLGPGTWSLFITSAEYGFQEREISVPEDSFELIVVEVVLQPGEAGTAELTLRVVDPRGVPVDGAEVFLDEKPFGNTSTGGALSLQGLLPGPRNLLVGGEYFREAEPIEMTLIDGLQEKIVTLRYKAGSVQVITRTPESPVPDAVVRFMGPDTLPPSPLGPMGDAMFELDSGDWQILLTSESFGLQQRDLVMEEDSDELHIVEVVMNPGEGGLANLNLRVLDPDGQAIAGADVFLDGVPLGSTTNTGGISLTGLSVGSRELEVSSPLYVATAERVRLLEGDLEKELVLDWAAGAARIKVQDAEGLPVTDAVVRMLGPGSVPPAPVSAYGDHTFGLSAGSWQALVMSESHGLAQAPVEIVEDGDGLVEVVVTMAGDTGGMASLMVRVLDEDDEPVDGAVVTIDGEDMGETGTGGALLVDGLAPGPSRLVVRATEFQDTESIQVKLAEGPNERIYTLAHKPGVVTVIVKDDNGSPVDAEIQAVGPADMDRIGTGADGTEEVTLRPGTWQIIASTPFLGPSRAEVVITPGAADPSTIELVISPTRVSVAGETVVIKEKVKFDFGKATLRGDSDPILQEVANTLLSRTGIIKVEIQGHADDVGGVAANQALSQKRAEAVLKALVERGVSQEILTARGYGLQRPVDTNETEEGRANNRRVAFDIVEQGESEE